MNKARLIIINNQVSYIEDCRHFLENVEDIEILSEAGSLGDAFYLLKKSHPDIVIMDTLFKYTTGVELIKLFKEYSPNTLYIILSAYVSKQHIRELFDVGISAYIAESDVAESLILAIRNVMEGKIYLSPAIGKLYTGPFDASNDGDPVKC